MGLQLEQVKVDRWNQLRAYHRDTIAAVGVRGAFKDVATSPIGAALKWVNAPELDAVRANAERLARQIDTYGPGASNWGSRAWDATTRVFADESAHQRSVVDSSAVSLSRVWREVVVQSFDDAKAGARQVVEVVSRGADLVPWLVVGLVAYTVLRFR